MALLIAGLVSFLGVHSVRIWGESLRTSARARLGENRWKGLYSLLALGGLVAIVFGYGEARTQPVVLWALPLWSRHLAALLVLFALVLLAARPGSRITATVRHPMTLGTGIWAAAHLLANGTVADLALFGGFLLWAVLLYPVALRRDARLGKRYSVAAGWSLDAQAVLGGALVWAVLTFWAHAKLFGVSPLG